MSQTEGPQEDSLFYYLLAWVGGGQILISLSCQTVSSPVLLIIPDVTIPKQENQQQLSIISNSMGENETDQRSWSW